MGLWPRVTRSDLKNGQLRHAAGSTRRSRCEGDDTAAHELLYELAWIGTLLLLLVLLILMLVGSVPAWPHSRSWGYYPSGGLGLVVLVLVILLLTGRI